MKATVEDRAPMLVVGIETRTNNALEMSGSGKISALWKRARSEPLFEGVAHAVEGGTILAVYSDYDNREKGDYSFLICVEVTRIDGAPPPGMVSRSIPGGRVARLLTEEGSIPDVLIALWKQVWSMSPSDLGGRRAFTFDIERYDERARDPRHAQIELTLSIE